MGLYLHVSARQLVDRTAQQCLLQHLILFLHVFFKHLYSPFKDPFMIVATICSIIAFAVAFFPNFGTVLYYGDNGWGAFLIIASLVVFVIFQLTWCVALPSGCIFLSIALELIIEVLVILYFSASLSIVSHHYSFSYTLALVLYTVATILVIIFIISKRHKKAIEKLREELNQEATSVEVVAELPTSNNQSEIQDQEAPSTTALEVETALPLSNGIDEVPIVHDVERIPDDVNTPTASARVQTNMI